MARTGFLQAFSVVLVVTLLLSALPADAAPRAADRRAQVAGFGIVEHVVTLVRGWVGTLLAGKEGMLIDPFGVHSGDQPGPGVPPTGDDEVVVDPNG